MPAMPVDCLVVGGGAAGLAAASEAAHCGVEVVLVDERKSLGGVDARVTALTSSLAWGLFPDRIVGVVTPGESLEVIPRVLILATGSEDRLLPFPGWEHPSVVTVADGLELASNTSARLRWVVAGIGEMGAGVARALRGLGQDVVAYADASSASSMGGTIVTRAVGRDRLDEVELRSMNGSSPPARVGADYLCAALARAPRGALAWLSGCTMEHRSDQGGYVPVLRDVVTTSEDDVLVAGDAAGLCFPETAAAEGRLAGFKAAERLAGVRGSDGGDLRMFMNAARESRERDAGALRAWTSTMWELETYYVRAALADPENVLCRCEAVSAMQVGGAVQDGALTPGDVKRATRAGMGECQGTHCRALIARAVSLLTGRPAEAEPPMSFRPPVRPLALSQLLQDS
jgi:NADPH-dependent 2,4-dienoyl-CoA reductase/sulfur reductase-like enzyme